ncbi:MAG: hypothetical protein ACFHVJ_05420 [Aestuariibacter sp.]
MQNIPKLMLLTTSLLFGTIHANASETIAINPTTEAALLDGRCGNDEWQVATKLDLPAQVAIYLMHDKKYFYICAKGKAEDITVLDLTIENNETGHLHNFHLSAQMGESVLRDNDWKNTSDKWDLKGYAGFWVPYSGLKEPENRKHPIWAKGTHRQVQVLRKKFPGNSWNMMFGVSAINHEGDPWAELHYPESGVKEEKSTFAKFSFAD